MAAPSSTAGGGGTFHLTNLDSSKKMEIPDPPGMDDVKQKRDRLNGMVDVLAEKVGGVLQKQERDFLAAYRAHNYNVQKELQDLRNKVAEAENSLQKNDKVHKLEEERSWYRKEALRLDAFTTSMKKDLKAMREKLEGIEDDRNWLERQLKASKKQNKLLRAELEIRLDGGDGGGGGGGGGVG
jgi:chromosome segregation ATPase